MKRALVLSGGGAKGAFQVGVISRLVEEGLTFDFVSGVSVGALNAVMTAQGEIEKLREVWLSIRSGRDIYRKRLLGIISPLFGAASLYHQKPLERLVRRHVNPALLRERGVELRIGMVNLKTGEYQVADQAHPQLASCILASTAIPLAFPPVQIGKSIDPIVDGGIRNVAPLGEAIDWGAEEIHVVLCNPEKIGEESRSYSSAFHIVMRALDIMINEIIRNDIEVCQLKNRLIEEYRKVDLFIYEPPHHLYSTLDFKPDAIRGAIASGEKAAQERHART